MLPGIRFLLAAILLSTSVVVFGLGAAALLRAAHEDFVSNPAWRVTPETKFAQQNDSPTLAMLRVESPAPAAEPVEPAANVASEVNATTPATRPAEQPAAVPLPPEKTVVAAVAPTTPAPSTDTAGTEAPPAPPSQASEPPPAIVASGSPPALEQPVRPQATQVELAATGDTKRAATDTSDAQLKASEAAPVAPEAVKPDVARSEPGKPDVAPEAAKSQSVSSDAAKPDQANVPTPPKTALSVTKIAKLDHPAVKIEEPSAAKLEARRAERAAEKAKARAEKKAKARRLATQRARAAQQAAVQRATDPFGQTQQLAPAPARTRQVQSRSLTPAQ